MADKNINILLTLQSKITGDLAKVSRTLDKTKESLQSLDRMAKQSRRIAGDIAFIGTAISGVFGLSMMNAGKYSLQVAQANDKLTNSYAAMQVELANALLPTYNQFINVVINVTRYVQSLDSAFKEKIVRILAITAVVGVAVGVFGSFASRLVSLIIGIGKIIIALSKFAIAFAQTIILFASANPVIAALIVSIGAISLAIIYCKKEIAAALEPFRIFFDLITKLPGGQIFDGVSTSITNLQNKLTTLAEKEKSEDGTKSIFKQIEDALKSLSKVLKDVNSMPLNDGLIVNSQRMKEEMDRIRNFKLLGNEGFLKGFSTGINKSISELRNFAQLGQNIAMQTATAMSTYFSDSFFAIFTGDLSNLEEAFSNFAKSILRMISDIIAQYLTLAALSSVVGGPFTSVFSGLYGTMHTGGAIPYAHSGRAFDEVDVRLQKGEGVLSRRGLNNIGGKDALKAINSGASVSNSSQPIVNINLQTWDAQDIIRNRKMIEGVISSAISNNSGLRRTIKNA